MTAHGAGLKAPPIAPPPAAFSWTGFYVGANIGGAWTPSNGDSDFGPLFPPFAVLPPLVPVFTVIPGQLATLGGSGTRSGVIGGGQIGYNWQVQVQQFVLGAKADEVGTFAPVAINARLPIDQATARLNYRFGGPVVARY